MCQSLKGFRCGFFGIVTDVCMYVCMYIYIYIYMYVYVYVQFHLLVVVLAFEKGLKLAEALVKVPRSPRR